MGSLVIKRVLGYLGGLAASWLLIVAAACGPLQQPGPATAPRPAAAAPTTSVPATSPGITAAPVAVPAQSVALLLPLSGAQRGLAEAVRDGFIAAYMQNRGPGPRADIRVYDEERPDAAAAYRAAVAAGATLVVGPLLKESVARVAAVAGPATTLALNYLDGAAATPAGFYQFALSPEDEARQAAERAVADGHSRALALAPDNDWGRRMVASFEPALVARGGQLLDYRLYDPGRTDFTADIERLLQLDRSRARHRQLSANLGVPLEFEPRRRGDADCIFLAASVAAGRLIRPQLRFLYAGDLATYATSAIYPSSSTGDAELDGVMFSDAPLVLGTDQRAAPLRATLITHWGSGSLSRLRFYGMGFDAYELSRDLAAGTSSPMVGLSGTLSADAQGRIHRRMPWAEFRNGEIAVLPDVAPADATSRPPLP